MWVLLTGILYWKNTSEWIGFGVLLQKMTFCDYFDGFRLKLVFQGKAYLPISFTFLFRLLAASSGYFRLLLWLAKTFSAKIFKVRKLLKHLELWKLSFMSCLRYAEVIFTTYNESYWKKRTFTDEIFKNGYSLRYLNISHKHPCNSFGIIIFGILRY